MEILIPEELTASDVEWLTSRHETVLSGGLWRDAAKLRETVRQAKALMVRNQTQVTAELMEAAPDLIAVGRLGVGLDNIDVPAASKLGIVVIAPLDANAMSVAELALGLMLALARKLTFADRSTKAGNWDRKGCMGFELAGKRLAVCGFGRVGRLVAQRARAFGMRISVFDPLVPDELPLLRELEAVRHASLASALADADIVTAHLPLTSQTQHLFNATAFSAMKRGACFINTARGGIVDEAALLAALRRKHLVGAALDVRETEPPNTTSGFETMENVILTPHIGAATTEAQTRTFHAVAQDVDRLLRGEPAVNYVNFPRPRRVG